MNKTTHEFSSIGQNSLRRGAFPEKSLILTLWLSIMLISPLCAGDNFNAGMITSIYQNNIKRDDLENLTGEDWSKIITTAINFATHVCLSYENYISPEFAKEQR